MKKIIVAIVSMTAFAGTIPVQAAPIPVPQPKPIAQTDVQQVQYRGDRRNWDRDDRRYYKGYRGYRDHRPGYRRSDDGWWYPLAAFGAGAIIGGAIASPPAVYRQPRVTYASSHIEWCSMRYRTYRAYDNTYVPRVGYRAPCISPYS